jgi:uncharacterized phage protein (TIGR01671 family)
MGRVIKFRAWDEEDKYMAYPGDCVSIDPKADTDLCYCDMETVAVGLNGQIYLLDECGSYDYPESKKINKHIIVEQFTGLLDKNGKEIYEGDIVRITDLHALETYGEDSLLMKAYTRNWIIEWGDYGFKTRFYDDKCGFGDEIVFDLKSDGCEFEIIGNAHEGECKK